MRWYGAPRHPAVVRRWRKCRRAVYPLDVRSTCESDPIEAAPDGAVVWQLAAEEVPGFGGWFGGFHRFANGNTLIANSDWYYHAPEETAIQLVEVTRDKRVVWQLGVEKFWGKKPGSLEPRTDLVEHLIIGIQWLAPF